MRHLASVLSCLALLAPVVSNAVPVAVERPQRAIEPSSLDRARAEVILGELSARTGASWRAWSVNGATGTVSIAYGSGVDLGLGNVDTSPLAVDAATGFVTSHPDFFAIDAADLELWRASESPTKWGVNFRQLHQGLRVIGGRANVTMTRQGRVFVVGSNVYRDIDIDTTPVLSAVEAGSRAALALETPVRAGQQLPTLMILPVHETTAVRHHLVWQVEHWTDEPFGHWFSYVDAHDGEIVWLQSAVYHLDVMGSVTAVVEDFGYCDGESTLDLDGMTVEIMETGETATTDANGNFTIPHAGVDPVTLRIRFEGPWADANRANSLPDSIDAEQTVGATPGSAAAVHWDVTTSREDERDVFFHTNRSHTFIKNVDPTYTGMDYAIPCQVGVDAACNANWDGFGTNYFREQGGCANTARIGNVVYHEYGHGVTWYLYGDPDDQPFGRIHEGNSDVMANHVEGTSLIGNGFNLVCDAGIRDSDNTLCWPEDATGGGHADGQMIGGFHWEARNNLMATHGAGPGADLSASLWHFGRKIGLPLDLDEQVFWTFVEDDDNGNLDDGTPNYDDLCDAANARCFACPDFGVEIRHDAVGPLTDADTDIDVSAKIWSTLAALDVSQILVRYRVDEGAFLDVVMSGSPADSMYMATIPGQPAGSILDYYVFAEDLIGTQGSEPSDAPTTFNTIHVAPTVWDDFETDQGWQAGIVGDDATGGIWERVDPEGSFLGIQPVAPSEDNSVPGTHAYVTEQELPGAPPWDHDVDEGTTTLQSPIYNLSGATEAVLNYHRWFTDDVTNSPQEEFWVVETRNDTDPWVELENTTESINDWIPMSFDLIDLFGASIGNVRVRFVAADLLPNPSTVEAGVDDFFIVTDLGGGVVSVDGVPDGIPGVTMLAPARPNPARAGTAIRYQLQSASAVRLDVYDISGRRVRRLVDTRQEAGFYALRWDGAGDDGRRVGAGVYFTELVAGSETFVEKLTILP